MTKQTVFNKNDLPSDITAREFSDDEHLDDFNAFQETADPQSRETISSRLSEVIQWRAAKSISKLRQQVNQAYPGRNKASDGTIGDLAHCPGSSDHCPNIIDNGIGVVTAIDITHDPDSGCDMHLITRSIAGDQDSRIKYIIYNREICSSYAHAGKPAWTWRSYSGSNPHTRHAHFSVLKEKTKYDNTNGWKLPSEPSAMS